MYVDDVDDLDELADMLREAHARVAKAAREEDGPNWQSPSWQQAMHDYEDIQNRMDEIEQGRDSHRG